MPAPAASADLGASSWALCACACWEHIRLMLVGPGDMQPQQAYLSWAAGYGLICFSPNTYLLKKQFGEDILSDKRLKCGGDTVFFPEGEGNRYVKYGNLHRDQW